MHQALVAVEDFNLNCCVVSLFGYLENVIGNKGGLSESSLTLN